MYVGTLSSEHLYTNSGMGRVLEGEIALTHWETWSWVGIGVVCDCSLRL